MPRRHVGPRVLDKTGTFYAVLRLPDGRRLTTSLRTKDKLTAHMRWPAAFKALQEATQGVSQSLSPRYRPHPDELYEVWDSMEALEPRLVPARALFEPEELAASGAQLSWSEAVEIARDRWKKRKGVLPSKSWEAGARAAERLFDPVACPLALVPADIRRVMEAMRIEGKSAGTIQQRMATASGIIDALVREGHADSPKDYSNPFKAVDVTAPANAITSYKTPTREHYWRLGEILKEERPGVSGRAALFVAALAFSGMRLEELRSRRPGEGDISSQPEEEASWISVYPIKDSDKNDNRKSFSLKNSYSSRDVPIPEWLAGRLVNGYPAPSQAAISKITKEIDAGLVNHSWRHGYKTAAREAMADQTAIEVILGHSVGSKMEQVYGEWPRPPLLRAARPTWKVLESWMGLTEKCSD